MYNKKHHLISEIQTKIMNVQSLEFLAHKLLSVNLVFAKYSKNVTLFHILLSRNTEKVAEGYIFKIIQSFQSMT